MVEETNGLVVPENVIQQGPEDVGQYVFTISRDGTNMTANLTPVKVVQAKDGVALIASGLTEGQEVVVDGQYRLEDGSKIRLAQTPAPSGSQSASGGGGRRGSAGATNQPSTNQARTQIGS
jgi:multidrug efflux system membrane fusion protein